MQQPIYVIDTNILVDYPDIIPAAGKEFNKPKEPTSAFGTADCGNSRTFEL